MSRQTIRLFRPSNGTQGAGFISGWCGRCKRDRVMNGEVEEDMASEQDCCSIIGTTYAYDVSHPEYPREWRYNDDGDPVCTAFEPVGAPDGPSCATRDALTVDMFEVKP